MDEKREVFADEVDLVDNFLRLDSLLSPALRGWGQSGVVNKEGGQ